MGGIPGMKRGPRAAKSIMIIITNIIKIIIIIINYIFIS